MADPTAGADRASPTDETCCAQGELLGLAPTTHDFLKALASPTRQRIMLLFARGTELSVGEIAERAGISQSTASEQLTLLRRGHIVTSRRDGKIVRYRADRDGALQALTDLQTYLRTCC
ncbi:MAG TPA: metalloregulator ArsR/SmtB family transcription factor [Actinophytocola sp.]|uniref:ArsR/SmtB family transcription factor n=1 Tax=Actinophytocola sp. TaxID=1872138 RepID=UPI002DBBCDD0|nr:metalloregulator ArsR/SmtB family transcription factor [Actinophytocola sp.]HEU5470652.1 metalloregulator ArsR/SmtB family transcription factor [Actinophytocola sp.]